MCVRSPVQRQAVRAAEYQSTRAVYGVNGVHCKVASTAWQQRGMVTVEGNQ